MTKEDIIRMAKEAGLASPHEVVHAYCELKLTDHLERFAALVAAAARAEENEACAKVCDVLAVHPEYASDITKVAAQAIRAMGMRHD